jgi:hypothetical protein
MTTQHTNPVGLTDRAVGVLTGLACGDALGAAYEFGGPIPSTTPIGMVGGGFFRSKGIEMLYGWGRIRVLTLRVKP